MGPIIHDAREMEIRRALEDLQLLVRERMEWLRRLAAELEGAGVELVRPDRVGVGSRMLLQDLDTGDRIPIALSTRPDNDAGGGDEHVHVASPLGRALLDAAEGDVIEIGVGATPTRLRVLDLTTLAERLDTMTAGRQGTRR